jgi:mannosyltransferase OCH1-like enzyme
MIPKIIHQTWKSKTDFPDNFYYGHSSFKQLNPEYKIQLTDDDDNLKHILNLTPTLIDIYKQFPREIYRVDFIRPILLYFFGGIYADMDFLCLKPLNKYDDLSGVILGRMGSNPDFVGSIPNAIMASSPKEIFWMYFLAEIVKVCGLADKQYFDTNKKHGPESITGPTRLRESVLNYQYNKQSCIDSALEFMNKFSISIGEYASSDITLLAAHIWYPINWNDALHQYWRYNFLGNKKLLTTEEASKLFPNSEVVTYWAHSWGS